MRTYIKSIASVALVLSLAIAANWLSKGAADPVAFVAGSALWWAVRAYYIAEDKP